MIPIVLFTAADPQVAAELAEKTAAELIRRKRRVALLRERAGAEKPKSLPSGAAAWAELSPTEVRFSRATEAPWGPEQVRDRLIEDVDLIVGAGFADAHLPKVAVLGPGGKAPDRHGLLAVVGAKKPAGLKAPLYAADDITGLADLLEQQAQNKEARREVTLYVNGERVVIKTFIKDFFLNTIGAMVDSLKHTQNARRIVIAIDREPDLP